MTFPDAQGEDRARMRTPPDVLVLASAQYSDRSWVNCQYVATGLAERHAVLFIDSIGLRAPRAQRSDLQRIWRRIRDAWRGATRVHANLAVSSPTLGARVPLLLERSIHASLSDLGMSPGAVITYLPTWERVAARFENALRIYHCVDEYAANPGVDSERILQLEKRLLANTDVVWAVSEPLAERLSALHRNVHLLPNVADVERFAAAREAYLGSSETLSQSARLPEALAKPIVLYLGNLARYKVDLPLLARLAAARPDWSWVLIGPIGRGDPSTDLADLRALTQVHYLGEMGRDEAPAYVAAADVCLLPLRQSRSTEASAPLKLFEYLAAGRPVVSTPIPAVQDLARRGVVRTARTDAEWIAAIESALRDGPPEERARREEATAHGWSARIEEIESFLQQRG